MPKGYVIVRAEVTNPEQWAEVGSGFNPVGVDTQLIYEHVYYGGPEGRTRFAEGLAELLSRAPLTAADHFYFAENDPMSRPEHLPDRIPSSQRVIPRTLHATISGRSVLWRDIEERMP